MSNYLCPECGIAHGYRECRGITGTTSYNIAEGEHFLQVTERASSLDAVHLEWAREVVSNLVFALDAERNLTAQIYKRAVAAIKVAATDYGDSEMIKERALGILRTREET